MIAAFEAIGCRTVVISGNAGERRRQIQSIKNQVRRERLKIDVVYSESAGWPNAFSDGGRSFHPFLDVSFLRFMKRNGVPVSLFYRDAYHRSREFFDVPFLQQIRRHVLRYFAEHDLRQYNDYVSLLYLPSIEMRAIIPEYRGEVRALPPGGEKHATLPRERTEGDPVRLLYVGGLGDMYRLHNLFRAVQAESNVRLTVCTRPSDWRGVEHEYRGYLTDERIKVVHRSGDDLLALYADADVAVLSVEPNPYRDFAVPVKLFEYIGHGKPILATERTLAGRYIADHELGWVVGYEVDAIQSVLSTLTSSDGTTDLRSASARVAKHADMIGWDERARQVLAEVI